MPPPIEPNLGPKAQNKPPRNRPNASAKTLKLSNSAISKPIMGATLAAPQTQMTATNQGKHSFASFIIVVRRLEVMEQTSEIIGSGLERLNRKRTGLASEDDGSGTNAVAGLPENPMAPPVKRRKTKAPADGGPLQAAQGPVDPPLQKAPAPVKHLPSSGVYPRIQDINNQKQPQSSFAAVTQASAPRLPAPKLPPTRVYSSQASRFLGPIHPAAPALPAEATQTHVQSTSVNIQAHDIEDQGDFHRAIPTVQSLSRTRPAADCENRSDVHMSKPSTWALAPMGQEEEDEDSGDDQGMDGHEAQFVEGEEMEYEEESQVPDAHDRGIDVFKICCMEVDEVSPSEDERNAETFLKETADDTSTHDVLDDHHQKNRPNRPPQAAHLEAARMHQEGLGQCRIETAVPLGPWGNDESSSDEEEVIVREHAKRHSKSCGKSPKPTTLKYYRSGLKIAIENAKKKFRGYVALNNAFPKRSAHLKDAAYRLSQQIADCEEEGFDFTDEDQQQTRNTNVVVFQEATTYRGKMKEMAAILVRQYYKDVLEPPEFESGNQLEEQQLIAQGIEKILGADSLYLRGGKDVLNRTNNFAHPCIRELCIRFYYGRGEESVAYIFQQEFEESIPEHAVALVMTCIYNALEEYKEEGYLQPIPFQGEWYRRVFNTILDLIDVVKENIYHKNKWDANRASWARAGMKLLKPLLKEDMERIKMGSMLLAGG
ncbi:hypothetical protein NLJ89_g3985 [Agrocybe chaxingu]|uniref:DUF6532 domain-containing protein n=1 Tax=Agrocybe chaxingu TaxID=84603 RepID=A0A9W8K1E5_9AGAR|nr:hypothetical protein NLJ89_g3985 [Agrocybe chaxingu]